MRRLKSLGRPAVWVAVAWAAFVALAAWLWGTRLSAVVHPPVPWVPVGLAVLLTIALVAVVLSGGWRLVRGPRRGRAVLAVVVGLVPGAIVAWGAVEYETQQRAHDLTPTVPLDFGAAWYLNAAELLVSYEFPHRVDGDKVVLFHDGWVADPTGDVRKADEFVRSVEGLVGRPIQAKIYWVRGHLTGVREVPLPGFAPGTSGPSYVLMPDEAGQWLRVDRRQLARAVLIQRTAPGPRPPQALTNGFGYANERPSDVPGPRADPLWFRREVEHLAVLDPASPEYRVLLRESFSARDALVRAARLQRERGMGFSLCADLFHSERYHYQLPNDEVAAPFVAYLLRRFEPARPGAFGDFASRVRPGTAEAAFQEVYGVSLADAERDFWADCETRAAAP